MDFVKCLKNMDDLDNHAAKVMSSCLVNDASLTRITQPKAFGGHEADPSVVVKIGFELGRGCGSVSWCTMVANGNAMAASYWPLEAQHDVWRDSAGDLLCGTFVPTGTYEITPEGYLIEGQWPFASNCDNSKWAFVSARPRTPGSSQGGPALFLVPHPFPTSRGRDSSRTTETLDGCRLGHPSRRCFIVRDYGMSSSSA